MTKTITKKPGRKTLGLPKKTAQELKPAPASAPAIVTPGPDAPPASEPAAAAPVVAEQPAQPKAKTPKAKAATRKAKPRGKSVRIYEATLKHPEFTGQQLAELLIAEGLESTGETIGTISSD